MATRLIALSRHPHLAVHVMLYMSKPVCAAGPCQATREPGRLFCALHGPMLVNNDRVVGAVSLRPPADGIGEVVVVEYRQRWGTSFNVILSDARGEFVNDFAFRTEEEAREFVVNKFGAALSDPSAR